MLLNTPHETPSSYILARMKDLRTLTLTGCINRPSIFALDPTYGPSEIIRCPKLEELILYAEWGEFELAKLERMAKGRESSGAKLWLVRIVGSGELLLANRLSKLRTHVAHVEYRAEGNPPKWDSVPDYESN